MRSIILDPCESDHPSAESYYVFSISKIEEHPSMDEFFVGTVDIGIYPQDERWYKKQGVSEADIVTFKPMLAQLETQIGRFDGEAEILVVLHSNWDEIDILLKDVSRRFRVLWYTTA